MIVVFLTATNFFYLNFFPQFPRRCWSFWFHLSCGSFFFLPVLWRRLLCFIWCFFFSLSTFSSLLPNTFFCSSTCIHIYILLAGLTNAYTLTHTHRHIHTLWDECTTVYSAHYSSFTLHSHAPTLPELLVLFFILFCCVQFFSVQGVFQIHCTNICLHRWCVFPLVSPQHTHTHKEPFLSRL